MVLKAKIYLIIFCCFSFTVLGQNLSSYDKIISEGEELISNGKQDAAFIHFSKYLKEAPSEWRGKLFLKTGLALSASKKYAEALPNFDSALVYGRKYKDLTLISESLINLGAANIILENAVESLSYNKLALESIEPTQNDRLRAVINYNIGYTYKNKGLYADAINYLFNAAQGFKAVNDLVLLRRVEQTLGNVYRETGKDSLSIIYHERALITRRKLGDRKGISSSLNDLGNTYKKMRNFEKAIELYQMSLAEGDSIYKKTTLGNLGEVYFELKQYPKSEDYLNKALAFSILDDNKKSICNVKNNLGRLYLAQGKLQQALQHLSATYSLAKLNNYLDILLENTEYQQQLYEVQGNLKKALDMAKEHSIIKGQIFNLEQQEMIEKFTFKFKANDFIKRLQVLMNEVREYKLSIENERAEKRILWLILAISVLTILFLILAFLQKRRFANFQKARKIEVQHRTKNFLQTLINLFEYQKFQSKDLGVSALIEENETRVEAMLMVHRSLSQNMDTINFSEYSRDLVRQISQSYQHKRPEMILDLEDNIIVESNQATILALILNELVSNSFKHGLSSASKPVLKILLKEYEKELVLEVEDNGTGYDKNAIQLNPDKGLGLIEIFVQQLKGEMNTNSNLGTTTRIKIKKQVPK